MGIKVLSLFDGMSCGQIAFEELGIKVDRYVAYEIDKYPIKVTQHNYPNTEQMCDAFPDNPTKQVFDYVAESVKVGCLPSPDGTIKNSQGMRIYSIDGKSVTQSAQGDGFGAKTGLYAVPYCVEELSENYYHGDCEGQLFGKIECKNTSNNKGQPAQGTRVYNTNCKSICLDSDSRKYIIDSYYEGKTIIGINKKEVPIYQVKDGKITIKGKQYPIKLKDGYYIIRSLTVTECKRLQTVPEWYDMSVISNSQAYKCLGNGWTVEVIKHLISSALKTEKE